MDDSGAYRRLQMSSNSPISRRVSAGEVMAVHSPSWRTELLPISALSAARAPTTVCFLARSARRASVEDSCSMMRPSC